MKASTVISILFVMDSAHMIKLEHSVFFSATLLVLVYLKLSMMLLGTKDIFSPFENLICSVFFGGMWDALKRARSKTIEPVNGTVATDAKVKKS